MADETTIEYLTLADLHERRHPENPKDHDVEALSDAMTRFGFTQPILICERTGKIAAGHGRLETLEARQHADMTAPRFVPVAEDGTWSAPVIRGWSSLDDEELLAYVIADNRQTELGGWKELLPDILERVRSTDLGLQGVGFSSDELDDMLAALAPPIPPSGFNPINPDEMSTDYRCPSCSYEWSGQPKPGEPTHEPAPADV